MSIPKIAWTMIVCVVLGNAYLEAKPTSPPDETDEFSRVHSLRLWLFDEPAKNGNKIITRANLIKIKEFILKNGFRSTYCNMYNNNPAFHGKNFHFYLNPDNGQKNINCDPDKSDFNTLVMRKMKHASGEDQYRYINFLDKHNIYIEVSLPLKDLTVLQTQKMAIDGMREILGEIEKREKAKTSKRPKTPPAPKSTSQSDSWLHVSPERVKGAYQETFKLTQADLDKQEVSYPKWKQDLLKLKDFKSIKGWKVQDGSKLPSPPTVEGDTIMQKLNLVSDKNRTIRLMIHYAKNPLQSRLAWLKPYVENHVKSCSCASFSLIFHFYRSRADNGIGEMCLLPSHWIPKPLASSRLVFDQDGAQICFFRKNCAVQMGYTSPDPKKGFTISSEDRTSIMEVAKQLDALLVRKLGKPVQEDKPSIPGPK